MQTKVQTKMQTKMQTKVQTKMQTKQARSLSEHKASLARYSRIAKRTSTIKALDKANNPDARKIRKAMNVQYHGNATPTLGESWNPDGLRHVKGKCKAASINSNHKSRMGY